MSPGDLYKCEFIRVSSTSIGWTPSRMLHVKHHATQCILPHMAGDEWTMVTNFRKFAHNQANVTRTRHLNFSPATSPLESITMDIGYLRPTTTSGIPYVVEMVDRYSEMARAVPLSKTNALHVTSIFYDHWIIPQGYWPFGFLIQTTAHTSSEYCLTPFPIFLGQRPLQQRLINLRGTGLPKGTTEHWSRSCLIKSRNTSTTEIFSCSHPHMCAIPISAVRNWQQHSGWCPWDICLT